MNSPRPQKWFEVQRAQLSQRAWNNLNLKKNHSNQKHGARKLFVSLLFLGLVITVLTSACSETSDTNDEQSQQFPKITDTERLFTAEDFLSIGFKQSKEYDVAELPAAISAIYGFWKPDGGESVDYEIRFYTSHDSQMKLLGQMELYQIKTSPGRKAHEIVEHLGSPAMEVEEASQ